MDNESGLRIAVYHELPSGGAKRTLYETVKRLSQRHLIHVYSVEAADGGFCDLRPVSARQRLFPFTPARLFASPLGRLNQWQRWRDLRRLDRLARSSAAEIDGGGYDVVFAQPSIWSQAPLSMVYLRTPVVYYCHEIPRILYEPDPRSHGQGNPVRTTLDRLDPLIRLYRSAALRYDRKAVRAARRVLVNSEYTRYQAIRVYGIDPRVCYHGVDVHRFRPLPDTERRGYVLSVGSIQPRKGFGFLIESLARIPAASRPGLQVVGNAEIGSERRYLRALAATLGVDLSIEVGVSDAELVRRYNEAALVAYAPHGEPFGLVPLEAMACGTPVVGVDEGGIRESVASGATGLLVKRDETLFARAIQRLLEQPALRADMGREGRRWVLERWRWELAVERIEEQLRWAAGSTPVGASAVHRARDNETSKVPWQEIRG